MVKGQNEKSDQLSLSNEVGICTGILTGSRRLSGSARRVTNCRFSRSHEKEKKNTRKTYFPIGEGLAPPHAVGISRWKVISSPIQPHFPRQ